MHVDQVAHLKTMSEASGHRKLNKEMCLMAGVHDQQESPQHRLCNAVHSDEVGHLTTMNDANCHRKVSKEMCLPAAFQGR